MPIDLSRNVIPLIRHETLLCDDELPIRVNIATHINCPSYFEDWKVMRIVFLYLNGDTLFLYCFVANMICKTGSMFLA